MALSPLATAFINRFQGGFPIAARRPFEAMANELGAFEAELMETIQTLLDGGQLSRFGPIYDASRLGGGQTLAALVVPESRFAEVTELVNELPAVAHNYRREHRLNMWFVVAAPTPEEVSATLAEIQRRTKLRVYNFPKQHEFYLGLWLALDEQQRVDTVPVPVTPGHNKGQVLDDVDYRLLASTQAGFALVADPLLSLAEQLELERDEIVKRLHDMLDSGAIRRIGAIPNHYRLGLRGNGMTVWDVPDDLAIDLGGRVGALDFVSHSYLRPRYAGIWPYNLFAMVHGHGRDEVLEKTERVQEVLEPYCRGHDILFSSEVLKKTGLRLAA